MQSDPLSIAFPGAGGLAIQGELHGPADGFPVILSHGGGQTRHAWGRTAERLAEAGFRIHALDLRGHGDSGWAQDGLYAIEDYAEDLRLLAATFDAPPVLVGASLGGIASLLAAGEEPCLPIAGLCLVDVSPHLRPEGVEGILGFMRRTASGFDTMEQAANAIGAYLPHRPKPRDLDGIAKNLRSRADGRFYWHWDPATIARPLDPESTSRRLERAAGRITAPALLVRGARSELVTAEVAAAFMALFRDGHTVDVAGARHMVAGDRNDRFGSDLLAFAERVRDRREDDHAGQ
ncbi:alpha/beta fold hydrolase [Flavisphingomonas formosensis]|uniref:alpha/beta fold hydrolase n=1 Tax=Flavisphingomonas formosensis TaxID=861534 RepID=UPI0012FBF236|nr:alpha/beta hydrolase [Sphingomonas formosensis]